jgi:hypothetical protein
MQYAMQPLAIFGVVLAATVAAPIIHWFSSQSRSVTSLGGGVSGFILLVGLALALGPQPLFRAALLWSLVGGGFAALGLHGRRSRIDELSIRPY